MKNINKPFRKIIDDIKKFRDERDWMQFHNPKDMAQAVSIEANELMEHFLWMNEKEVKEYVKNKKNLEEISDEIADTMSFLLELTDNLGIDIEEAISNKRMKNAKKYPIAKAKGKATKYNKL